MKKIIALIILNIGCVTISFSAMYNYSPQNLIGTPCIMPTQVTVQLNGFSFFGFSPNDSVKYVVYFGDGGSDSAYFPIYNIWVDSIHCELQHYYNFIGNYQPLIKVVWPNLHTDSMTSGIVNVTNGCTPVSGHIYKDLNGNCTYDSLIDIPFPYMFVNANSTNPAGNTHFFTNNNGYYSGNLVTGLTYSLTPNFYQNYAAVCGSGIVGPFNTNNSAVIADWAINYNGAPDVYAWVHGGRIRPGLNPRLSTTAFYGNTGPSSQFQFQDTLTLDPQITFNSTINGTVPIGFNNNYVWWSNTTLQYSTMQNNESKLNISTAAQIGDIIHFKYRINPILNELDTLDNSDEWVRVVGNSYDPNYIEPRPIEGIVDTGITLRYMIHFQNTGTDTAFNIFIIDTLDADLEFQSFEIMGATHQLTVDYLTGNIIKFNFYNINLLDSGTNLALSQGFLAYKIRVKSNLAIGTQIHNIAYIYFDINPPIVTNKTIHHIGMIDGIQEQIQGSLVVYPNPTNNKISLNNYDNNAKVIITDITGKLIMQTNLNSNNSIAVSQLNAGLYFIYLESSKGKQMAKFVKE